MVISLKNKKKYMVLKHFVFCMLFCGFQFSALSQNTEIALRNKSNKKIIYNATQKLMAIADKKEIQIMLTGGNIINNSFKTSLDEINDVCFSFDGDKIFAVGKNSTSKNAILLYEARSGTLVKSILVGANNVLALAVSRDGNQIAVCTSTKMAMVFSLQTEKLLYQFKNYHGVFTDLTFNKKGTQLFCSSSSGHFFDVSTIDGSFTKVMSLEEEYMRCVEVSNDGKYVACGFDNGVCKLIQPENKYAKYHLSGNQKKMFSLSFSEDDRYLASSSSDQIVNIWSLDQMALKREIKVKNASGKLTCVRFDPGGKLIYGTDDNSKKLVQIEVSDLGIVPKSFLKNDLDKNPPQITLAAPLLAGNEAIIFNEALTLKGAALDETGVYVLKINGNPTKINEQGEFLVNLKLGMGDNNFLIEATDVNDLTTIKKFKVIRKSKEDEVLDIDYTAKNYLLAIGIDNYSDWSPLKNAVNDAKSFQEVLKKKYNYKEENITIITNEKATKQNIIEAFKLIIEKVGPNDKLIIYFSGHGYYDNVLDEGYWITQDSKKGTEADYLPNSFLIKMFKQINAKHIFLIADACFSGSLFIDTQRGNLENAVQSKSRWALTSGRLEFVDDGRQGEHSPFAKYTLEYLNTNTKSKSSVTDLISYVKEKVTNETKQVPTGNPLNNTGDEGGEFIFELFGN
jgi:WD40 repeat protein